jgi:hypothetical protein
MAAVLGASIRAKPDEVSQAVRLIEDVVDRKENYR